MKYSQLPRTETNPFEDKLLETFKFSISLPKSPEVKTVHDEDGVLWRMNELVNNHIVKGYDPTKFVKVYQGFGSFTRGLSSCAEKVLRYIMENLVQDIDEIIINLSECTEFCDYKSSVLIYKGLTELCERRVIAKKAGYDNVFFINVTMMFNGSRMKLRSYAVARSTFIGANRKNLINPPDISEPEVKYGEDESELSTAEKIAKLMMNKKNENS